MEQSIFELIKSAVTEEGGLSEAFALPDEVPENQLKFAAGAMDGILFYHMAGGESEESEGYPLLINAIEFAAEGKTEEAAGYVYDFATKHKVLGYIDLFQKYVIDNESRISFGNVIRFAVSLMLEGTKVEAVKFGMSLLELIDWERQDVLKGDVRILALEDEFTLYAAFLMRDWENPNKEMFDILKKVKGWGRVHLVRMIEPDSDEIEEWLVRNGVHNDVLPAYSGLDCFEKVHYLERIQSADMDLDTYRGLADILDAMLDEGPVAGLSALENKEEVMQAFFDAAMARTDLEAQDYAVLLNLKDYVKGADPDSASALGAGLIAFLHSSKVRNTIQSALRQGEAFEIARRLGMDYQEYAFEAVLEDCTKNAWTASRLIADGYKVQEIVDLMYDRLNVESLATGAADEIGLGEAYEAHNALTMILQELGDKAGIGEKLIKPALKSPVVSNRHMALSALEKWLDSSKAQTIQEMSPELGEYLASLLPDEVRGDLRQRMEQMLDIK
ncbi:MAG: hypothetical protein K2N44_04295 [Lachnospiraceae bacterium]|nr:hypothetical protein [Lachnospiraceae bacterium]